jgi:hypothetical protein
MIVLGFLASLGGGFGSSGTNYTTNAEDMQSLPFMNGNMDAMLPALGALAVGAFCFLFILGIAFWLLKLVSEAGLIDAAYHLDSGQESSFRGAMSTGWHKLGKLVGLNLLLFGSIAFVVAVIIAVFGVSLAGAIGGAAYGGEDAMTAMAGVGAGLIALFCCLLCGLILLSLLVGILYTFAQRALVLEDLGVLDSIRRGWQVVRENLAEVIILLILFFLISIGVGIAVAVILIPLGIFSVGPTALRLFAGEQVGGFDIGLMILGFLIMAVVGAAIRSIYMSFQSSAFTLAFKEFTEKQLPAKATEL